MKEMLSRSVRISFKTFAYINECLMRKWVFVDAEGTSESSRTRRFTKKVYVHYREQWEWQQSEYNW